MRKILIIIVIVLICSAACDLIFLEDNSRYNPKCPSFKCNQIKRKDGLCYTGTGSIPEGNRKTTLWACKDSQICNVPDIFAFTLDAYCQDLPEPGPEKILIRYPGEACVKDHDCRLVTLVKDDSDTETIFVSKCHEKKCVGNSQNKKCFDHSSCTVGNYCSDFNVDLKKRGVCKPYSKVEEACKTNLDCSFGLVCYNKKCHRGDLPLGTEVEPFDFEACETNYAAQDNEKKWRCAILVYDSTKHTKLVNNEVVECEYNSNCYYANRFSNDKNNDVKIENTQKCICSFSGKGYCPFAAFSIKNRSKIISKAHSKVMAKEKIHHTLNRDKEYIMTPEDLRYSLKCIYYYLSPLSYGSSSSCAATSQYEECTLDLN